MKPAHDDTDDDMTGRVVGEYREMPGLALTSQRAERLWDCDSATCRRVAEILVERGALRRPREGRLVRKE